MITLLHQHHPAFFLGHIDFNTCMMFISGSGLGAGIGRKVDKNTEAVEQATMVDISLAKKC